jgi:hypothetical protein
MKARDIKKVALHAASFSVAATADDVDFFLENHGIELTDKNREKFKKEIAKIADSLDNRIARLEQNDDVKEYLESMGEN